MGWAHTDEYREWQETRQSVIRPSWRPENSVTGGPRNSPTVRICNYTKHSDVLLDKTPV